MFNAILDAAELCIPSKIIPVRKNQPQWLTSNIIKLIRKKNRIHRKARRSNNQGEFHYNHQYLTVQQRKY
jgi:hypothetical protein